MIFPNPSYYKKNIITKVDKTLGYVYFLDKEHPLSSKLGKVYYHRHVYSVKIGKWVDKSYHVHHIDENKQNNSPDNLEAVSPIKHGRKHIITGNLAKKVRTCPQCQEKFITKRDECCSIACASALKNKGGIHNKISKEELEDIVWRIPTTKIAEKLNCSDVMVSKLCKRWGIDKPPRGYWAKQKSIESL